MKVTRPPAAAGKADGSMTNLEDRHGNHLYDLARPRRDPEKTFAELLDGRWYRYQDVDDVSARFANALVDLGVEPGDRVAVQVEKSIEAIMLYLGTIRAGAVFLPLNTAYTAAEIEYFVGDAEPARVRLRSGASRCAEADRGEGRRPARDARRLSVAGCLGRHALGPDARGPGRASTTSPRGPDDLARDPLHLGHDRALQGRDADARQPRLERRDARRHLALHAPTTC